MFEVVFEVFEVVFEVVYEVVFLGVEEEFECIWLILSIISASNWSLTENVRGAGVRTGEGWEEDDEEGKTEESKDDV